MSCSRDRVPMHAAKHALVVAQLRDLDCTLSVQPDLLRRRFEAVLTIAGVTVTDVLEPLAQSEIAARAFVVEAWPPVRGWTRIVLDALPGLPDRDAVLFLQLRLREWITEPEVAEAQAIAHRADDLCREALLNRMRLVSPPLPASVHP